jgi:hypothetical protein
LTPRVFENSVSKSKTHRARNPVLMKKQAERRAQKQERARLVLAAVEALGIQI